MNFQNVISFWQKRNTTKTKFCEILIKPDYRRGNERILSYSPTHISNQSKCARERKGCQRKRKLRKRKLRKREREREL